MFIMVDGIDGSGKSTAIDAWKEYLVAQSNAIVDLKTYWKEQHRHPTLAEVRSYDFIFSGEPTYTGIGQAIREELINKNNTYPSKSIAEAYALDRLVLYTQLLLPLLADGKCILQDRGVSTSLAYQYLSDDRLNLSFLLNLDGNKLALEHRPDHLILVKTNPRIALERLNERAHKQDNVIFERLEFQTKAADFFFSPTYQNVFTDRGTIIHELSGESPRDIMKQEAIELLKKILSPKL